MANQEHLALLQQGVEAWNDWRREHPGIRPDLAHAQLKNMYLSKINLRDASLQGAHLSHMSLVNADLMRADFSGATLHEVEFIESLMHRADFHQSDLSGVDLRHTELVYANLTQANLYLASLAGANLRGSDFTQANMEKADCDEANLRDARLDGARLVKASLLRTVLERASLREADLTAAHLRGAILNEAVLTGANFSRALLQGTNLGNVDLSQVKGLESVWHDGRSYVDIQTLLRSQGAIPDIFLRGVGASEKGIEYAQALKGTPFPAATCFLIYETDDQKFVQQLHANLQHAGVRCWLACVDHQEDEGMGYHESITNHDLWLDALNSHDKLLLVLSELTPKKWDDMGRRLLLRLQVAQRLNLQNFVILCLDQSQGAQMPDWKHCLDQSPWEAMDAPDWLKNQLKQRLDGIRVALQERSPLDFAGWKNPEVYQKAFNHLLDALRNSSLC
ncbi:pentapeptide repeat-containing protein [Dictyobacter arantiisoli]|uniref:TIR domain-containing protein n=1 Tax=Dictyobacter arantiisoli TaxID=2014874 RepID=A0A5A5THL5_9CHLR|nr:pentapeptide repeat-containing protein [Dictyobacter arantiisoli]GCF10553.1 hypothetical protein KDI_41170 [Dictyobacter arantiisoli]